MVEGGRLESVWAARSRGFESHLLRQCFFATAVTFRVLLCHNRYFLNLCVKAESIDARWARSQRTDTALDWFMGDWAETGEAVDDELWLIPDGTMS